MHFEHHKICFSCVLYQLAMFTSMSCLQDDPMAINEIRDDLRQECEKFGVVKKILIFDVSRWSREIIIIYRLVLCG